MRSDMHKVIVERPRRGSSLKRRKKSIKRGYRKYVSREMARDNLPRHEPMLGAWMTKNKTLNENLSPLKRFLRSQVGRPWNMVHRDLWKHISSANAVQSQILDHFHRLVALDVEIEGRQVVRGLARGLRGTTLKKGDMYVCPRTGLLRTAKDPREPYEPTAFRAEAHQWYLRNSDGWWEVRLAVCEREFVCNRTGAKITTRVRPEPYDVWCDCLVSERSASDFPYPVSEYAVSKRGLRPDEAKAILKRYGAQKRLIRDLHNWSGHRHCAVVQEVRTAETKICMRDCGRPIRY